MKKKLIDLHNVKKIYKMGEVEVRALNGIHLHVNKGDFISVIGPSGSGKSTMMSMIGCLDRPTEGQLYLDGHDISKMSESHLAQIRGRKIGFIFQKFNLIPSLSAIENVTLPTIFQGYDEDESAQIGRQKLALVGLEKRMNHRPMELSGGEQQRVAIARALMMEPEVILGDEPTGNLDSKTGTEILNLLKRLHKEQGTTLIIVTHDSSISEQAERIIKLKDGKIISGGD